ncbi:hypothetical protein BH10BDE1_BH10BDE1_24400 [soil metagenome]
MAENFETYREVLKYEYDLRHGRNPSYSLNAYARDLDLSSSRLSEILSGKQGLSSGRAKLVGTKIGYEQKKLDWFCNLVEAETARSRTAKASAERKLRRFKNGVLSRSIELDRPMKVSWLHFAIRRMTSLQNFLSDANWIATRLKVSVAVVTQTIDELLRARMLSKDSDGTLTMSENVHSPIGAMDEESAERYCSDMLAKALESRKMPKDRRRMGIHFFTIDEDQMPELIEIIEEFEDRLDNLTYKTKRHERLMATVVSAFPLADAEASTSSC